MHLFLPYKSPFLPKSANLGVSTNLPCEKFIFHTILFYFVIIFTIRITTPRTASTTPIARFKVTALTLFANFAAIRAHNNVDTTQNIKHIISGIPPIAKYLRFA